MSITLQSAGYNAFSLGGLIQGIGQVAGGILTGNPGGVIGGIETGIHAFGPGGNPQPPTPSGGNTGGIYNLPVVGGIAQGIANLAGRGGSQCGTCPKGYHLNKHRLPPSKHHDWLEARTVCVRNRHIHPLNSRAASRSITRLKRAKKMFGKIERFVGPHRSRGKSCGCKGKR